MGSSMHAVTPSSPLHAEFITGELLARLTGIGPCELIDGRIVPMTPTSGEHGRVEGKVFVALHDFVRAHPLGLVLVGEVGIYTRRGPDRVRGADVLFISHERYAARDASLSFLDVGPELVVEILSPRDTVGDLTEKLHEYFEIGARFVWVVDPRARRVLAYRAVTDVRELASTETLTADDVLPGFQVLVSAFFED